MATPRKDAARRTHRLIALAHAQAVGLAGAVLALSLVASYAFWIHLRSDVENVRRTAFESRVDESMHHIEGRLRHLENILHGVAGISSASTNLTTEEFHAYVASLQLARHWPEVRAVGVVVSAASRQARPLQVPVANGAGDDVFSHDYAPVFYLERWGGDGQLKVGYDMVGDPVRRHAMAQSRDVDGPRMSRTILLKRNADDPGRPGVEVYLPLQSAPSVLQSQPGLAAWVFVQICVTDMMTALLQDDLSHAAADLDIRVYDGPEASDRWRIYGAVDRPGARFQPELSALRLVTFAGADWAVEMRASQAFRSSREVQHAYLLAASAVASSLMVTGLTWLLASGRARARTAARQMNEELLTSESRLRDLNEDLERRVAQRTRDLEVDIAERKRVEESLVTLTRELREAWRQLTNVEESNRHWLAGELHDSIGSALTAINLNLTILRDRLPDDVKPWLEPRITDSIGLLEETVETVRGLLAHLRPPVLDDYGLATALRWYAEQVCSRADLRCAFRHTGPDTRFDPQVEIALFRIAQGVLTNVVKHAHAKQVAVTLDIAPETVQLTISDDGVGFVAGERPHEGERPHWGLVTMRERAESIGARLVIESAPGNGTRATVTLPRTA